MPCKVIALQRKLCDSYKTCLLNEKSNFVAATSAAGVGLIHTSLSNIYFAILRIVLVLKLTQLNALISVVMNF